MTAADNEIRAELAATCDHDVLGDWRASEAAEILADMRATMAAYGATLGDAFTFALLAPGEPWPDDSPRPAWFTAWRDHRRAS